MFKSDMRRLGADWDSNLSYQELIEIYESKWNEDETLARYAHEVTAVFERESSSALSLKSQYTEEPFASLGRVIDENNLAVQDVRKYLAWRSKNKNLTKAREVKAIPNPLEKFKPKRPW